MNDTLQKNEPVVATTVFNFKLVVSAESAFLQITTYGAIFLDPIQNEM